MGVEGLAGAGTTQQILCGNLTATVPIEPYCRSEGVARLYVCRAQFRAPMDAASYK